LLIHFNLQSTLLKLKLIKIVEIAKKQNIENFKKIILKVIYFLK